ncbi:taurine dioxygenase [Planctomycetota bacterium]|nr:taurine dioxygenase [Planctomycetota bacterium]
MSASAAAAAQSAPATFTRFAAEPYTPAIGATISGLDLRQELDAETAAQLRAALARFGVLVLREQDIAPEAYLRFAQIFGQPDRHNVYLRTLPGQPLVEVLESDPAANRNARADAWHSDVTWRADAPATTLLHGKVIPKLGGDTLWASTAAAYDRLSEGLRAHLATLEAVHSFETSGIREALAGRRDAGYGENSGSPEKLEAARLKFPPVVHPVVKTHPITGRKVLYVNPGFTSHIRDIPKEQSNQLLNLVYDVFKTPEVQLRLRWSPNTIAVWDNRQTVHYGAKDYGDQHRLLHRITLQHDGVF